MNGYGDLLDEINLWMDDLDSLNEYFKYKYIIQIKKIPLNNCPLNIKEKMQFFKEQVLKSGVDAESFYKKDTKPENEYLGRKKNVQTIFILKEIKISIISLELEQLKMKIKMKIMMYQKKKILSLILMQCLMMN